MPSPSRALRIIVLFVVALALTTPRLLAQQVQTKQVPLRPISSMDGKDLYKAYCAQCHGLEGKGDGPIAATLKKPPADLTQLAARNDGKFARESVIQYTMGSRPGGRVAIDSATGKVVVMMADGPAEMPAWGSLFRYFWPFEPERLRFIALAKHLEKLQAK